MVYEYRCNSCERHFDVVKSAKDMERNETCDRCGEFADRIFVPRKVHFTGTKVEHPEYNPGLGIVTKNSKHRRDEAKARGMEEVGSEPVEKIHKKFEQDREERREKSWDDVDKGWIGDGSS